VHYNSYKIDKIAVLIGLYVYGPKIYNGILSFQTKNNDFALKDISLKGDFITQIEIEQLKNKKSYSNPNYQEKATLLKRIPDYRNQLLWIPNTPLSKGDNALIFYTSDNLGTYKITVEGYTLDGNHVVSNKYFTVN